MREEAREEASAGVWNRRADGAGERNGDPASTEMATFRSNEANDGGD